jgi:lipopolysaccharide/colanic/teichoic acid biosynthesis glycosyltransferase
MPSYQTNPTYGPIVRLERIGFNDRMINVYKFRTMYPYSEFLQEYIYEKNNLEKGGKFKDDFRVMEWGRSGKGSKLE